MAQDQRVVLTAAYDCTRCKGTGVVLASIPIGEPRFGGPARARAKVRGLCSCVSATKGAADE